MLDRKTAQEISGLCVERIDWTVVGAKGGAVTVFTGRGRYHASYGAEGDPVEETSKSGEPGGEAYEYVANMELDRRFVHDWSGEYYWPDWPNDTAEAWRQFREEIEDLEPDDYVPFEVGPSVWKLMFALSEITGIHYLAEAPLGRRPLRS